MTDMSPTLQPTIDGDGLSLRPLRRSDVGPIELYAGDQRVARMTATIPHPLPPGAASALLERATASDRVEDIWAIDATPAGGAELVGLISLCRVDAGQSEIGYWVGPPFWEAGVAGAAVAALLEANPQANRTVFGSVFQDNPASARVLTGCGFVYVGDAECYSVARGATVPTWTYLRKM